MGKLGGNSLKKLTSVRGTNIIGRCETRESGLFVAHHAHKIEIKGSKI